MNDDEGATVCKGLFINDVINGLLNSYRVWVFKISGLKSWMNDDGATVFKSVFINDVIIDLTLTPLNRHHLVSVQQPLV